MLVKMELDKVRILPAFKHSPPNAYKLEMRRYDYSCLGQYRPITVDSDGWLVDGYATYLVLRENRQAEAMASVADDGDVTPVCGFQEKGGAWHWYWITIRMARRLVPGRWALVYAEGRLRLLRIVNIKLMGSRAQGDARAVMLPALHKEERQHEFLEKETETGRHGHAGL